MPRQCEGFGRLRETTPLSRCPYDALADDQFCGWHRKVADHPELTLDGKKAPSWRPKKPRDPCVCSRVGCPGLYAHDPLDVLLAEFADG